MPSPRVTQATKSKSNAKNAPPIMEVLIMKEIMALFLFTIEYLASVVYYTLSLIAGILKLFERMIRGIQTGVDKLGDKCGTKRVAIQWTIDVKKNTEIS